ncbi:3009_t:CDS:1 [Cetraspora pellucida]|uniref:3009_t:CDS:1 n=1 Tax=Cetraspora pellucida TaxID=1433469 RepID=A0ACA9LTX7_9GLOM|nr:3009_t:CDS:1 [Cetraspora pellucida]
MSLENTEIETIDMSFKIIETETTDNMVIKIIKTKIIANMSFEITETNNITDLASQLSETARKHHNCLARERYAKKIAQKITKNTGSTCDHKNQLAKKARMRQKLTLINQQIIQQHAQKRN